MSNDHNLLAISPLDGRYAEKVDYLGQYFSEAALNRYRILMEIEWFIFLFNDVQLKGTHPLKPAELRILRSIYEQFDVIGAKRVKEIEKTTNHDVKACEYYMKECLKNGPVEKYLEFIHFGCTSEDINNLAYTCMFRDFTEREYVPMVAGVVQALYAMAVDNRKVAMLARTHGQPASPTTLGKELINYVARIEKEMSVLSSGNYFMAKINGAVGNYNAHLAAYPEVDWLVSSKRFVQTLGLDFNQYTTQIEPHDGYARVFDSMKRMNTILIDLSRDFWTYISMNYFGQVLVEGEVGSSTMPHKVNPIDFENAEGNLGIANALFAHFSEKLPISRMQRDLSDSTVLRNVGSAFAYSILAFKSLLKGIQKCEVNKKVVQEDLKDHWELLAEPIQTVMRKNLVPNSYEKLKALTRGKGGMSKAVIQKFVKSLKIPAADKKRLLELTPEKYTGMAEKLVESYSLKMDLGEGGSCSSGGCGTCGTGCG